MNLVFGPNTFTTVSTSWTYIIEGLPLTFVHKVFKRNQVFRFWFYIIGSPAEARHYRYEMKFDKNRGKVIKFDGMVRSINEDYESFCESEDTFEMSFGMVKKYLNAMSQLEYTFKIRNLKEEAKDEDFESGIEESD